MNTQEKKMREEFADSLIGKVTCGEYDLILRGYDHCAAQSAETIARQKEEIIALNGECDDYLSVIQTLQFDIARLNEEIERLHEAMIDKAKRDTMLTEIALREGGVNMTLDGGAAGIMAEAFAKQFADSNALNYLELSFESQKVFPDKKLVVTIQSCDGKTSHQLRAEAEAELSAFRESAKNPVGWEHLCRINDHEEISVTDHDAIQLIAAANLAGFDFQIISSKPLMRIPAEKE